MQSQLTDMNIHSLESEILPVLVKSFPRAFFKRGSTCRPLRVGIYDDLDGALPPEIDRMKLRTYIGMYTKMSRYLRELQSGVVRIDLNGMPAGYVTGQEARFAQARWQRVYDAERAILEASKPKPVTAEIVVIPDAPPAPEETLRPNPNRTPEL